MSVSKELVERFLQDSHPESPRREYERYYSSNDNSLVDITVIETRSSHDMEECKSDYCEVPFEAHEYINDAPKSSIREKIVSRWRNLVSSVEKQEWLTSPPPVSQFTYNNYYNNLVSEEFYDSSNDDSSTIDSSSDSEVDENDSTTMDTESLINCHSTVHSTASERKRSLIARSIHRIYRKIKRFLTNTTVASTLFLCIMGLCAAVLCTILELSITRCIQARLKISSMTDKFPLNYGLWIGYSLVSTYMAECCVQYISPFIIGSGIPEIKTLVSGVRFPKFLGIQVMVGKGLSMVATMAAGFSVGRIGPFVHMTSCFAYTMMKKIPIFKQLYKNEQLRNNMLSAACSVGVSAILGAPFGGVLFSLELMTNYYLVSNLWKGVVAASFGSFFFYFIRQIRFIDFQSGGTSISLFPTDFPPFAFHPWEYLTFIGLGVICGLVGTAYNTISVTLLSKYRRIKILREARFSIVLISCVIFSLIDFHIPILKLPIGSTLAQLFGRDMRRKGIIGRLTAAVSLKLVMTVVASVQPLPNGVIGPSFTIGACLGRLYAEVLSLFLPISIPGGYAVVGATCYPASVTRALSLIVIMSEITGQLSYIVPLMISTVVSVAVSSLFTDSLFIAVIKEKKLPFLPVKNSEFGADTTIEKYIETGIDCLSLDSTVEEIHILLKKKRHISYPIIESKLNPCVVGEVLSINLKNALDQNVKKRMERTVNNLADEVCSIDNSIITDDNFVTKENSRHIILNRTDTDELMLVNYEPSPFCLHKYTTLNKANFVFALLGLSHAYIIHRGKLVGVLTKGALIYANEELEARRK